MKLSVITICKDNLEELKITCESINSQIYNGYIEHIIIDGGSSNHITDYLKKSNKRFISERDSGIYDAFNKGITFSKGQFICFLNSGDTYSSNNCIQLILDHINYEIVWFCNKHIKTDKLIRVTWVPKWAVRYFKIMPPHQSTVFPRKFFNSSLYDKSFRVSGDFDLFLKNINFYLMGSMVNFNLVNQNVGGISNNGLASRLKSNKEALQSLSINSNFSYLYLFFKLLYKVFLLFRTKLLY